MDKNNPQREPESLTDAKVSEAITFMREQSDRRIEEILKEQDRTRRGKKLFLFYYEKSLCNVGAACMYAKITRRTYQNWIKADPTFRAACLRLKEYELDTVEDQLRVLILNRCEQSIHLYLKAHHPAYKTPSRVKVIQPNSRNNTWRYCEKCEINHKGGMCPKV